MRAHLRREFTAVWLHGVVPGRTSGGCEWRARNMVNFDETILVLTNKSATVDRAFCDVEVLWEMKKAKKLRKSDLRRSAANACSPASPMVPAPRLSCGCAACPRAQCGCRIWRTKMANTVVMPITSCCLVDTRARYADIALFSCIHDRCSSPTHWLEVTRQSTSSCCQYQPTIYRTLLSMSVS